MKLILVFGSYLAGTAALGAAIAFGLSQAIAPSGASAESSPSQRVALAPQPKPAEPLPAIDQTADRLPVWIAPTQKYPAAQFKPNNAARARQLARSGGGDEDWRLRERRGRVDSVGITSFTAQPDRPPAAAAWAHSEPIQFREKTEPR